jgi:hypothetical protein
MMSAMPGRYRWRIADVWLCSDKAGIGSDKRPAEWSCLRLRCVPFMQAT